MVNLMVEKATSDLLIGPDWARNIEICDLLNQDPAQAKDIVKGIKKRIWSKNSKVQLLALTLLETIVKNCGDIVHMHVAEKEIPHEMVKITRKKTDFHVKEKILILIDTWQEAFGGPRARYPQYYAAYQELLRAGAVFPQRSESSAPVFTPPQTQPLSSYPPNLRNPESHQETAGASAEPEYPTLSLTDIQNAQGIMEVLAEMLSAIDPANKEAVRQDIITDLVTQCQTYKQRILQLINSTSSESLLCQGLALNDDLQKVLDKYEGIASGTSFAPEISKHEPSEGLVDVDAPLVDTGENRKQIDARSASSATITAPPVATPAKVDPKFDLLSGDLISDDRSNTPTAQDGLALVPVSAPQQSSPVANQQNALALFDMFNTDSSTSDTSNSQPAFPSGQGYPPAPEFQHQQNLPPAHYIPYANGNGMASSMGLPHQQNLLPTHSIPYANGNGMASGMGLPQHEQAGYSQETSASWSAQSGPQQPQPPVYGTQNGETLPPPPWESHPTETNQSFSPQYSSSMQPSPMVGQQSPSFQGGLHPFAHQPTGNDQVTGMYGQHMTGHMPAINPHSMQNHPGMYPQSYSAQPGQMGSMYPAQMYPNQMTGYGYGYTQQPDAQYLDQRMYGMSMTVNSSQRNSSSQPSLASYLPPMKQKPKGDDKLFGDLVDMAKLKPVKSAPSGSL